MVGMMILEFLQKAGRLLCLWGGTALSILLVGLAGLVFLLLQMVSDGVDKFSIIFRIPFLSVFKNFP